MSGAMALRQAAVASQTLGLFDNLGGEPTLDELIVGVWEGLTAPASAACPVCGARMEPQFSGHARPVAGRCTDCGTTLS
jgi:hypothetical protein